MKTKNFKSKTIDMVPFGKEHYKKASDLVAARYRAERKKNPLLVSRFEDPEAVLPCLGRYGESKLGIAAVSENELIGFLAALPIVGRGLPAVWIRDWGHGAAALDRYGIYRMMYAAAAEGWVKEGRLVQAISIFPGERDVLDAWFSLEFGKFGVDALMDVPETVPKSPEANIRRAGPGDLETLIRYREAMARYFNGTPVFAYTTGDFLRQGNDLFKKQLADPGIAIWLACENSRPVGCMKVIPSIQNDFHLTVTGEKTCSITMAFIEEPYRGKGLATALLNKTLAWAKEKGYARCSVDFDSTNILGSRFWLSHFRPVGYGLERRLDFRMSPDWRGEG